jgi:hypothetical protein
MQADPVGEVRALYRRLGDPTQAAGSGRRAVITSK